MIRLRSLRLTAITNDQKFGAHLAFNSGLNVICAGNTSGKSTCLQAIIYALGLERSLGPQLDIPLPYAMRERIHSHGDLPYQPVIQSFVELELENAAGTVLSIRRDVVGGADTKLIQTLIAESPEDVAQRRDFFVHDPGAAQREDGFHTFLAKYIGWDLPLVARFDGTETRLYLEAMFPMLFIEQKRGWSVIQGPFPTFLRIQDVARRVMEYLLDLDAGRIRREKSEIRRQLVQIQQRWSGLRSSLASHADNLARLRGISSSPTAEFGAGAEIVVEVFHNGNWALLYSALAELETRIRELEAMEAPTAEDAAPELQERLNESRAKVGEASLTVETIRTEYAAQMQEHKDVEERVRALTIDRRRNLDALKLRQLGSEIGQPIDDRVCPTCHQEVLAELLPTVTGVGMALEENLAFVGSQLEMYEALLATSSEHLNDLRARYEAGNQELSDLRKTVRSLRDALLQPSSSPSRAIIEELVRAQLQAGRLRSIQESVDSTIDELRAVAQEWTVLQGHLKKLSNEDLTALDIRKTTELQDAVQRHLGRYGFKSFQPSEIALSQDNFRPLSRRTEDGLVIERELNFEVSASDAIRLKWSYYLALLEVAKTYQTNHPLWLIFDEPGQQEIDATSLHSLLTWTAGNLGMDQQLIVATSEPLSNVVAALRGTTATVISFDGFILQPVTSIV